MKEIGDEGLHSDPGILYPRACFFVGERERSRRRLLSLKGIVRRKDTGAEGVPAALNSLTGYCFFLTAYVCHICLLSLSDIDYILGRASVGMGNLCLIVKLGSFGEAARTPTAVRWMWVRLEAGLPQRGGNDGIG